MKNQLIAFMVALILSTQLVACGDTKVVKGVEYDTYGLINEDDKRNPEVQYEPCWGNIIWGVILVETIVAPIYFFGFSMFEPVGEKSAVKGAVPK